MPTFDFHCQKCGHDFESTMPFGKTTLPICPNCQAKSVQKLLSPPTVVFKGSGFYKTDSRPAEKKSSPVAKEPEKKVEVKKSEEKKP